ncbi:MAG: tRNA pseudouridine(55) synthase TruB [Clostridia bacterium]|nr:tRNA pseudouridine(55) synthase TruB [Clostridia bacterium]
MNGFVVLDKPEGVTSFKAVAPLRRIFNEKKVGHTGTLDPMATGVLPVALGKAARFIDYLPDTGKAYEARFRCGVTTDTLDITGKVISETEANVTEEDVLALLPRFRGEITQVPPMYSALSVGGQRLYELARKGVEVEREARQVTIHSLELTGVYGDEFAVSVSCSKGTYIRSLIADIGEALGCGAVMTALRRTRSNGFSVEEAHTPEQVEALAQKAVLPLDHPFLCYEAISVTQAQSNRFRNGGALFTQRLKGEPTPGIYRVYAPDGLFLGLGEIAPEDTGSLAALKVIGNE